MVQQITWKPDYTKLNPWEGMPVSYPALVATGFVPTTTGGGYNNAPIPLNPVQVAAIKGQLPLDVVNRPDVQNLTPVQQNILGVKNLNDLTPQQKSAVLAGNPIPITGGTAGPKTQQAVTVPQVTPTVAAAPTSTMSSQDRALAALAKYRTQITRYDAQGKPYTVTTPNSYDLDRFWNENSKLTADARVALLQKAGFSDKAIADIQPRTPRNIAQSIAETVMPDTGQAPLKQAGTFAAEMLVPGVYEARHWNELSGGQKALMIGIDAISVVPLAGAAARGAREVSVTGRSVEAARFGGAVKGVTRELGGYVTAPVNILIHPIGTAKSSFREVSGLVETIADPRKLPEASISNIFSTLKIRLKDLSDPAYAKAVSNEVSIMAEQSPNRALTMRIGDRDITLVRAPITRELGGGAASGTPFLRDFKQAMGKSGVIKIGDEGLYFSPTAAPRFSTATSTGLTGPEHGIIFITPETAAKAGSSGKLYPTKWGTSAELESVLKNQDIQIRQKLYTRVGPGAQYTELWLEKPLSASQIAKLKVEGLAEVLTQPFRPAIKVEGDALAATADDVDKLARELRASGNTSEARNLERAYAVLEQDRRTAPLLDRIIGRVSASELAKARANVSVETRRNLTPEDRRLIRQAERTTPREPGRETPRTPSRKTPREPSRTTTREPGRTTPREPARAIGRTPGRMPPRTPDRIQPRTPLRTPPPPEPPRVPPRQPPPPEPPRMPPPKSPTHPPKIPSLPPSKSIMKKGEEPTRAQLKGAVAIESGFGWWVKMSDGKQKFYLEKDLPGEIKKVKHGEKSGYRSVQTFKGEPAQADIKIGFLTAKVDRPAKEPGKPGAVAYIHNFDQGGIIPGNTGQPVTIEAQAGERIIPLEGKRELRALIKYAESTGYPVKFVGNKVLHDYAATNPEFSKLTGWPGRNSYQIDKNQNIESQIEDLRHELIEDPLMKAGVPYGVAHPIALHLEKVRLSPAEIGQLAKLAPYSVSHVHDDGDLTIKTKDGDYVVTTEGQTFKGTNKEATMPAKSEKQRKFMGAELGRLRAGKPTQTGMTEKQLEEFAEKKDNAREEKREPHHGVTVKMQPGGALRVTTQRAGPNVHMVQTPSSSRGRQGVSQGATRGHVISQKRGRVHTANGVISRRPMRGY